jgi:exosortase K
MWTELRFAARWPWPRIGMLTVMAFTLWGIKRHYATAEVGELVWILKPVASLSALVSGATFEWEPGAGYLSRERLFLIAKPCAGVNFMLAAVGMVGFLLSPRALSWRSGATLIVQSVSVGYAATVLANTMRIVIALWLAAHPLTTGWWTAARIHRLEGVAVYFVVLVALHFLVQRMETMTVTLRQARVPLISYYGVTVLLPLANGSGNTGRAFMEHLAFVLLAPLMLIALGAILAHVFHTAVRQWPADAPLPPDSAATSPSVVVSVPCPSSMRRTMSA